MHGTRSKKSWKVKYQLETDEGRIKKGANKEANNSVSYTMNAAAIINLTA